MLDWLFHPQLPRIVFELDYDWYGVPLRIEGLEIIPTRRLLSGSLRVTPQHNT